MGSQQSHSTHAELTLRALSKAYPNDLSLRVLREALSLLPSPLPLSFVEKSFSIDFTESDAVRHRFHAYFQPLTPVCFLEKIVHLQHGSSVKRCELLFHMFCHSDHFVRKPPLQISSTSEVHFMNFREFQAAIDFLVKGRIEKEHLPLFSDGDFEDDERLHEERRFASQQQDTTGTNERYFWLFCLADEWHEGRIDLNQFARVVCDQSPILNWAVRDLIRAPFVVSDVKKVKPVKKPKVMMSPKQQRAAMARTRDSMLVYAWYTARRRASGRMSGRLSAKMSPKRSPSPQDASQKQHANESEAVEMRDVKQKFQDKPLHEALTVLEVEQYRIDESMVIN